MNGSAPTSIRATTGGVQRELLVALDLDGTLEDSRADMVASVARVRARFGVGERAYDDVVPHVSRGMTALYLACFDDVLGSEGAASARFAEVRTAYERDYLENVAVQTKLYEGVKEALEELSREAVLAVVTNKPEALSRRLLEELGVNERIACVIGGDTLDVEKPDPRLLAEARKRARLDDNSLREGRVGSVMIGDSAGDVRMGRAFGAVTVWCAWGYAKEPGERPDHVAAHPRELSRIVRALVG